MTCISYATRRCCAVRTAEETSVLALILRGRGFECGRRSPCVRFGKRETSPLINSAKTLLYSFLVGKIMHVRTSKSCHSFNVRDGIFRCNYIDSTGSTLKSCKSVNRCLFNMCDVMLIPACFPRSDTKTNAITEARDFSTVIK